MLNHQIWRRLALLTGLCLASTLVSAGTVAAYPVTPEGEPLYVEGGTPTSSMPPEGVYLPQNAGAEPVSATVVASSGTDWGGVIAVVAGVGLAALAVIAAAVVLANHRRRSADAH
jgi:hypothetical protein